MNRAKPRPSRPTESRVFYGFKLTAPLDNRYTGSWLGDYGAVRF